MSNHKIFPLNFTSLEDDDDDDNNNQFLLLQNEYDEVERRGAIVKRGWIKSKCFHFQC